MKPYQVFTYSAFLALTCFAFCLVAIIGSWSASQTANVGNANTVAFKSGTTIPIMYPFVLQSFYGCFGLNFENCYFINSQCNMNVPTTAGTVTTVDTYNVFPQMTASGSGSIWTRKYENCYQFNAIRGLILGACALSFIAIVVLMVGICHPRPSLLYTAIVCFFFTFCCMLTVCIMWVRMTMSLRDFFLSYPDGGGFVSVSIVWCLAFFAFVFGIVNVKALQWDHESQTRVDPTTGAVAFLQALAFIWYIASCCITWTYAGGLTYPNFGGVLVGLYRLCYNSTCSLYNNSNCNAYMSAGGVNDETVNAFNSPFFTPSLSIPGLPIYNNIATNRCSQFNMVRGAMIICGGLALINVILTAVNDKLASRCMAGFNFLLLGGQIAFIIIVGVLWWGIMNDYKTYALQYNFGNVTPFNTGQQAVAGATYAGPFLAICGFVFSCLAMFLSLYVVCCGVSSNDDEDRRRGGRKSDAEMIVIRTDAPKGVEVVQPGVVVVQPDAYQPYQPYAQTR